MTKLGMRALSLALTAIFACGAPEGTAPAEASTSGATEGEGTDRDSTPQSESDASIAREEILVVALRQLPRGLDPLADLEPWAQRVADDLVFEGLTRLSGQGAPWAEPALSDRCLLDPKGGLRAVFCHLPPGRRFHDGSEVTMDDVVYSLGYWLDPRREWFRRRHGLGGLKSIEVVDGPPGGKGRDRGRWIRLGFSRAEPLALELVASMKIVPKAAHKGRTSSFRRRPIGTGPMRVESLADDRWVLSRQDGGRATPLAGVILRQVNDGAAALSLARRGEVHIVAEIAQTHIPVELGKPAMAARFEAWLLSPPRYDCLVYNLGGGLQSGPRLRAALHDAVPEAAIAVELYRAPGMSVGSPVDLHQPSKIDLQALIDARSTDLHLGGLRPWPSLDLDVEGAARAESALDSLGWKLERGVRRRPGGNLRISLMWDGRAGRPDEVARLVRARWGALGIRTPQATASWSYLVTLLRRGEFDVAMMRLAQRSDADLYPLYHSRGDVNLPGVADKQLDVALEAFRAAQTPMARQEAKQAIAARLEILRVATVLHAPAQVMLISRRVTSVDFEDDLPRLDTLSLGAPGRRSER